MTIDELLQQAQLAHQAGRLDEAELLYGRVLQTDRRNFTAMRLLGVLQLQRGDAARAEPLLSGAAAIEPDHPGVLQNWAVALLALKQPLPAVKACDRALRLKPDYALAFNSRANALRALGREDDAIADYDRALSLAPDFLDAWHDRGNVLLHAGRHAEALASMDQALARFPGQAALHGVRAHALALLGRADEALAEYDRAIALNPHEAQFFYGRGLVEAAQHRGADALASYDRAVTLKPDFSEAWNNRGLVLTQMHAGAEALASFERALQLSPGAANVHNNAGIALQKMGRQADAVAAYRAAIACQPDYAKGLVNLANVLLDMKRPEEALAAYDAAYVLEPSLMHLRGARLHARMQLCEWRGFESDCRDLLARIERGEDASSPFPLLAIAATPRQQSLCARATMRLLYPPVLPPLAEGPYPTRPRPRIAYLSKDLRDHATAVLMAGVFEGHDRAAFEMIAVSLGPDDGSAMRRRLENAFERFIDARNMSDAGVAHLIRSLDVDICVDLDGHTMDCRPGILARRPAPLQVSFLGYPGTMGADTIDYLIADDMVVPPQDEPFFSEKIVRLPGSYQPNTEREENPLRPSRADCGLPETGFVFCCFNNSFKITPDVFDVWMRLLEQIEGSVLWLLDTGARANLQREAAARGIAPQRLVFAPKMSLADHLARQRLADLFVDTLYYGAHTTASDALWSGLPLVTCRGGSFAGRVAASLLMAVGLPELITATLADYEALAAGLAREPARLAMFKARLAQNRDRLFDSARFARNLESAYRIMLQRQHSGAAPAGFRVDAGAR